MICSSTMLIRNKIFDSNFKKKSYFFRQKVRKLLIPNKFLIKKYKIENPIKKLLESIEESESEEDLEVTKIINKLMKVNPFESRGKKR